MRSDSTLPPLESFQPDLGNCVPATRAPILVTSEVSLYRGSRGEFTEQPSFLRTIHCDEALSDLGLDHDEYPELW